MIFVCDKDPTHVHENTSLFLAAPCAQFTGFCTTGVLVAAKKHLAEFGILLSEVDRERLLDLIRKAPGHPIVALPLRRSTIEDSKGKRGVWMANRDQGKRKVYFRCLACGSINLLEPTTPANISIEGVLTACEICVRCGMHQFIQLIGWAEYLSEARPFVKGGKHDD